MPYHTSGPPLSIYESHPPSWLPKASSSADLGYLGFHPPRPGQDEDLLTEANIKNGFVLGSQVNAETFSAQSILNIEDVTLCRLEALMNEVFIRRADTVPAVPSPTFRIPTRVTLNDAKRQAWFADLADPEVPLHKLGKSVPHGAKGHDLLDLLHSNNVAIPRAVWFLRVLGANETAGLRNKPSYNPVQYSVDWAIVVTSYMKKQLADIALPSAPRPGLNIKQTFKGVLSDSDTRERWISRFSYCLQLLRTFYAEGLVDNRTFLVWIVQQQGTCNLAQAGFITRLADEYLEGIISSRALTRPFIDACLMRLSEIRATSVQEFLGGTEQSLQAVLQRLCIAVPDSFISPKMWRTHAALLDNVLNADTANTIGEKHAEQNHAICQILRDNFNDIKSRNEAMLFNHVTMQQAPRLGSTVSDVKSLNSISSTINLETFQFFPHSSDITNNGFIGKLNVLLTWAVTPLQYGDHRIFAATTLIGNWRNREHERATRRNSASPNELLQDQLFEWLDSSETVGDPDNNRSVALLFGRLIDYELFSYANYIQRLIARGELGLSLPEDKAESRHRRFLRWTPLLKSSSPLTSQRKATLYGTRTRETPEETNERKIRREVRAALPVLFKERSPNGTASPAFTPAEGAATPASIKESCPTLVASPCFEQVRTLRNWFLPVLQRYIASPDVDQKLLLNIYSTSVEMLELAKCFQSILDVTLSLLEHSSTIETLNSVICTLHRFATIWACMGAVTGIVTSLEMAHQTWKAKRIQFRPLLSLLMEFDHGEHLSVASRDRIMADISAFTMALQPIVESQNIVPNVLPEILLLAEDPDVDAPSLLAESLWIKYRKYPDWAWKVWDNTFASLRQIPLMVSDTSGRRARALRYGIFLCHIDQHLAPGLDGDIARWFSGTGKHEVAALTSDAWNVFTVVLLHLSAHNALKTTTILSGLVYPTWRQATQLSSGHDCPSEQLRSVNDLCRRLLVSEDVNAQYMPPTNLLELQSIRTRREDAYHISHFPLLAASIPLLICIENNQHIPWDLRADSTSLRHSLSLHQSFRQETYRNLEAIRDAFEQSTGLSEQPAAVGLNKRLAGGLRMLLSDVGDDPDLSEWSATTSLLSPWKLAATVIQVQLILKQMSQSILHDASNEAGKNNLDRLIQTLFHHSLTSEAFHFAEMVHGADAYVVGKFINNGLKCVTDVLQHSSPPKPGGLQRAGELLCVLVHAAEPLRKNSVPPPPLESSIQDAFLDAIYTYMVPLESFALSEEDSGGQFSGEHILLLLRLLQFELGFQDKWSPKTRETMHKISTSLFKLALTYGTSTTLRPVTYPLIIDTLYYIYDEIPLDSKAASYDPFRNYPVFPASDLPSHLPGEFRDQLRSLLPHLSTTTVSNLVNTPRDAAAANIIHGTAVINRPWEWIENLGEPVSADQKDEDERSGNSRFKARYSLKNSGSLSLDFFGAHSTGEAILGCKSQDDVPQLQGDLQEFEDSLSAENLFKREWRETRLVTDVGGRGFSKIEIDGNASEPTAYAASKIERRASPASSVVSARGSGGSGWQSPIQGSMGTTVLTRSPNKRKATTAPITISDDEVEIIEGPVPIHTSTAKKARGKAPSKAKSRKR